MELKQADSLQQRKPIYRTLYWYSYRPKLGTPLQKDIQFRICKYATREAREFLRNKSTPQGEWVQFNRFLGTPTLEDQPCGVDSPGLADAKNPGADIAKEGHIAGR